MDIVHIWWQVADNIPGEQLEKCSTGSHKFRCPENADEQKGMLRPCIDAKTSSVTSDTRKQDHRHSQRPRIRFHSLWNTVEKRKKKWKKQCKTPFLEENVKIGQKIHIRNKARVKLFGKNGPCHMRTGTKDQSQERVKSVWIVIPLIFNIDLLKINRTV